MTAYVDYAYYSGTYGGKAISSDDFSPIAINASLELDGMTLNRIRINGITSYDADTQDLIKTAVCMLCDAINDVQDTTGNTSGMPGVTSESVGGYSYSVGSETSYGGLLQTVKTRIKTLMLSTGLCSVAVGGDYRPVWL